MQYKLFIVQPYITNYRLPVFKKMSEKNFNVIVCASKDHSFNIKNENNSEYFTFLELKDIILIKRKLFWQKNLLSNFFTSKPDIVFIAANPRYISSWMLMFIAKLMNKKIFLHGQGLYNKSEISFLNKITYGIYDLICNSYICYTESSKDSLKTLSIYNKSTVAENSIINTNDYYKQTISEKGILFIGRLRKGSNIQLLIDAVLNLQKEKEMQLHIIGGGESLEELRRKYKHSSIKFYGPIYDNSAITEISKECIFGCYPGDAGLSVLHYMSLSLPVIIHSQMKKHMGPEPSYVIDKYNGLTFERDNYKSLEKSIRDLFTDKTLLYNMQSNAYSTYKKITIPDLSERFSKIINENLKIKD